MAKEQIEPKASVTVHLVGVSFFVSTILAILLTGGLAVVSLIDVAGLDANESSERLNLAIFSALTGVGSLVSGTWLFWRIKRQALFIGVFGGILVTISVILMEVAALMWQPPWPASDLHGVFPGVQKALMTESEQNDVWTQRNGWGQRDDERSRRPATGVMRVAMIGDSFLEEGVGAPLSIVAEGLIGRPEIELINLGVSATSPDEYYYRLAHVALPLGSEGCVICIYLGNDLAADHRTLKSWQGVAAVTPRPSFLTTVGMSGMNAAITSRERPVLKTWMAGEGLGKFEKTFYEYVRNRSDNEISELLIKYAELPVGLANQLRPRMLLPEMAPFYRMLREPDAGRFRSYFLFDGTWIKATGNTPQIISDPKSTLFWVHAAAKRCAQHRCRFTVVLIPEGFAVDPRMQENWRPFAEMRRLTDKTALAGRLIEQDLTAAGIDVLNLTETLSGIPGTYLNVDGHWSELGIQQSATALANHLRGWLDDHKKTVIRR